MCRPDHGGVGGVGGEVGQQEGELGLGPGHSLEARLGDVEAAPVLATSILGSGSLLVNSHSCVLGHKESIMI